MTNFVRIVNSTGAIDGWGDIPASQIPLQAQDGMTILECSQDTVEKQVVDGRTLISVDLDWLKQSLRALVDSNVSTFRSQFITNIAGQDQIYAKKEAEAEAWSDGDDVANPEKYPFMIAEAEALGVSVSIVRQSITEKVRQIAPIMAMIEAQRVSAKSAILNSQSISQAIAASLIDFDLIMAN